MLLVATSDSNKPFLGFLIPVAVSILEKKSNNSKVAEKVIPLLSQLQFERSVEHLFSEQCEALEKVLGSIQYVQDIDTAKDLALLRERLAKIKASKMDLPKMPTHVIVVNPTSLDAFSSILAHHLNAVGYKAVLGGRRVEMDAVTQAYASVVVIPEMEAQQYE
jgi:hypothetical protein